jgi:hypothetical protein
MFDFAELLRKEAEKVRERENAFFNHNSWKWQREYDNEWEHELDVLCQESLFLIGDD